MGVVLIFAGFFSIESIEKLPGQPRSAPIYIIVIFGGILSLISIVVYLFDELTLGWLGFRRINNLKTGFGTKISNTEINIMFGRLENISDELEESMVVLPANEFFDDECINDKKSALGAYVNHKFTNQTKQVKDLIAEELSGFESREVEKEAGVKQDSFGVGTGVFLKRPMDSRQPILFLSVTTKRAGEGLQAEMSYIFQAVRKIQNIAADHRIDSVCVPVMCSGHGGLRKEVALFGLLLAICDSVTKSHGHHVRKFNVVVFQSAESSKPSISRIVAKRLLRIATGMFS
jgi:hypothetical protein